MDKELNALLDNLMAVLEAHEERLQDLEDWQEETHEVISELSEEVDNHEEELAVDDARLTEVEEVVGLVE